MIGQTSLLVYLTVAIEGQLVIQNRQLDNKGICSFVLAEIDEQSQQLNGELAQCLSSVWILQNVNKRFEQHLAGVVH
jgi:hypothetical protein